MKAGHFELSFVSLELSKKLTTAILFGPLVAAVVLLPSSPAMAQERTDADAEAIRRLATVGEHVPDFRNATQVLLDPDDAEISRQAFDTLIAMKDPATAAQHALTCKTGVSFLGPLESSDFHYCLLELAELGGYGRAAGPHLLQLLGETSIAQEQAYLIEALGLVRYQPAGETIETFLSSQDWWVVYAAVRSIGELATVSAIQSIREVESRHWLPEMRQLARAVATSLETGATFEAPERRYFGDYGLNPPNEDSCPADIWVWGDQVISFRGVRRYNLERRINFRDGMLIGSGGGEFDTGALEWKPTHGDSEVFVRDAVVALLNAEPDPIAVFARRHRVSYGYAIRLERGANSNWTLKEIGHFPAAVIRIIAIGDNRYAADADGRIVVFSSDGIEGLAACAGPR